MGETAVIVNELGEVGIDHHLLRRVDERTVLLKSGCVCCSLRGDLADELRDLLGRRERGEIPALHARRRRDDRARRPGADRLHAALRAGRQAPLRARERRHDRRRAARAARRRVGEAGRRSRHARRHEDRPGSGVRARCAGGSRAESDRAASSRRASATSSRTLLFAPRGMRPARARGRGRGGRARPRRSRGRAPSSSTSRSTGPRSASG